MNTFYILKKERLAGFLRAAMKDYRLVTPQPANSGDFLFQEAKDPNSFTLNYAVTSNTIKEFFFPQRETIFNYKLEGSLFKITPVQDKMEKETIFFGLRSCDVRAVHFQDRFFSEKPRDDLYWRKRDKGILVSIACNKPPRKSCFCASAQSGPFLGEGEGFDLQFIDLGRQYLAEVGTEKGKDLIKKYKRFFIIAGKDIPDRKSSLKNTCLKEFQQKYDFLNVYEKLKGADFKNLWEELGKRCTNCGGCEFICPTCFCFYTQDIEYSPHRGERIRAWDSCTFSGYSRMAQDSNPHEDNSDRVSRRFFCKLYNCYNWFRVFACTGCGRCSFVCPVNLDMESFIASISKRDKYEPLLKEL